MRSRLRRARPYHFALLGLAAAAAGMLVRRTRRSASSAPVIARSSPVAVRPASRLDPGPLLDVRAERVAVGVASGSGRRRARPYPVALLGLAAAAVAMLMSIGAAAAELPSGPSGNQLPPPSGLAVTATQTSLKLTWNPVTGANTYALYLDGPLAGTTQSTSWTFQDLQCGTTHLVQVSARFYVLESTKAGLTASTKPCSQPPPPPPPPHHHHHHRHRHPRHHCRHRNRRQGHRLRSRRRKSSVRRRWERSSTPRRST